MQDTQTGSPQLISRRMIGRQASRNNVSCYTPKGVRIALESDPLEVFVEAQLDSIDRKILKELQDDSRITNVELARRVGISAPPCLRRVRALKEAGYIKCYRALLD